MKIFLSVDILGGESVDISEDENVDILGGEIFDHKMSRTPQQNVKTDVSDDETMFRRSQDVINVLPDDTSPVDDDVNTYWSRSKSPTSDNISQSDITDSEMISNLDKDEEE